MTIETILFDAPNHLADPMAQIVFLRNALKTGDARYIAQTRGVIVRAGGMSQVARMQA